MEQFPIQPNEDRVIIRPEPLPDKTKGGLWIPDTAKGKPSVGTVMAVGHGKACGHCGFPKIPEVQVGMKVTFPEHVGIDIKLGDIDYVVIRAGDIQLFEKVENPLS